MILSDLQGRGTIHGIVRIGGGGGVTDYDDLTNRPKVNNIILTGNKTAQDLGLAEPSDIKFTGINQAAGWSIYRCRNITVEGLVYDVAYPDFIGTDGVDDGENGLVPAPSAADQGKFLGSSGQWEDITGYAKAEIIPITNGDGTTSRTFTFNMTPKFIKIYYKSVVVGYNLDETLVWGQDFINYLGHTNVVSISGGSGGLASISYGADNKSFTITGGNSFGALNDSDATGFMFVIY